MISICEYQMVLSPTLVDNLEIHALIILIKFCKKNKKKTASKDPQKNILVVSF